MVAKAYGISKPNERVKVMAKLHCTRHDERVIVLDMGTENNPIPITVHRNGGKRNEICDSRTLVIDGEYFTPANVIAQDWSSDAIVDIDVPDVDDDWSIDDDIDILYTHS